MSTSKVIRSAQNLVINQFMTKEAINAASFRPIESQQFATTTAQSKPSARLHDESIHLKFGFPTKEQIPISNNDDCIQGNCQKHVKEEHDRQTAFSKLASIN